MPPNDERSPSEAVVHAVASDAGVDPIDLEPLYDAVDPDSLDRLVTGSADDVTVAFDYEGYDVTVTGDGRVHLERRMDQSL